MSKIMLKMVADFLNISPEDISKMMVEGQQSVHEAVNLMRSFDARMRRIENALGILPDENPSYNGIDITIPQLSDERTNNVEISTE